MEGANPKVDLYLIDGCGRCPLGGTPNCKVNNWQAELKQLRSIILDCGLVEELKWSMPCYTFQGSNILLLGAFNEYCAVSFFKGALLQDANKILGKPGENTQAGRLIRFTNFNEVVKMDSVLKAYIFEAIEVEKAGLKVTYKKNPEPMPEELVKKLDEHSVLKTAFYKLTPGRQRGYILYFSAPRQSKTRDTRIEKYMQHIMDGRGLNDR